MHTRLKQEERGGAKAMFFDSGRDYQLPPVVTGNGEYARGHWPSLDAWITYSNLMLSFSTLLLVTGFFLSLVFGAVFVIGVGMGIATVLGLQLAFKGMNSK